VCGQGGNTTKRTAHCIREDLVEAGGLRGMGRGAGEGNSRVGRGDVSVPREGLAAPRGYV